MRLDLPPDNPVISEVCLTLQDKGINFSLTTEYDTYLVIHRQCEFLPARVIRDEICEAAGYPSYCSDLEEE